LQKTFGRYDVEIIELACPHWFKYALAPLLRMIDPGQNGSVGVHDAFATVYAVVADWVSVYVQIPLVLQLPPVPVTTEKAFPV
jgi:hypothetical protein